MAAQNTDFLPISRGGVNYKITVGDIVAQVPATSVVDDLLSTSSIAALSANQGRVLSEKMDALGTVEHEAATISARDSLVGLVAGDRVFVQDASADSTVSSGWAIYRYNGTTYFKIAEAESLDVVAAPADLSYVAATRTVTSSTGTSAVLSLADAVNAGLLSSAKLSEIGTATAGVATNAADIATNADDITANTASISTNTADVASNVSDIATNAADITANTASIGTNTTDIGTNTAAIAATVAATALNTSATATNASDIASNDAEIATNVASIGTNTTAIAANTAASHAAASTSGNPTTNPISILGQVFSFDIASLATAP